MGGNATAAELLPDQLALAWVVRIYGAARPSGVRSGGSTGWARLDRLTRQEIDLAAEELLQRLLKRDDPQAPGGHYTVTSIGGQGVVLYAR